MSLESLIKKLDTPIPSTEYIQWYLEKRELLNPLVTLYIREYNKLEKIQSIEEKYWKMEILAEAFINCLSHFPIYEEILEIILYDFEYLKKE